MKEINLLIIFSLFSAILVSQNIYLKTLQSPLKDNAGAIVETENGDIIMCTSVASDTFLTPKYIKFFKISTTGDTIASRIIKRPEDYYSFVRILKLDSGMFMAVGGSFYFGSNNSISIHNKVIYYTFNSDLDSISFKEITINDNAIYYLNGHDAIRNYSNHIITLCDDMSGHNIMILEANSNGDSIRSSVLVPTYGCSVYSITQKVDYSGYYITIDGDYNHLNHGYISHILTIDNELNFVSVDSLPGECAYFSQIRSINNRLLIGGRAKRLWIAYSPPYPPPYITEEYCIEKLNTVFQVEKQVFLSHVYFNQNSYDDTISYPALFQNFDFIDSNNIFTCHYREYPSAIYPTRQNYFVVANFNSYLDNKWKYYFGYDAYYSPRHIIATRDGGCFISGNRYDYLTQNQEYDVFYLKLDSTGIYTSSGETNMAIHSAVVFPNPGTDILNLESGPQVLGSYFQLYDLQGIEVCEERITASQQQIYTGNLPAGMYIWRIVTKGKIVDSGKWIKVE